MSLSTYIFYIASSFKVWDEADYVVPPAENGAFFVTTNVVITPNQTWGECPEVMGDIRFILSKITKNRKYAIEF